MKIEDIEVYGLERSIRSSGLPMSNNGLCKMSIDRSKKLGSCKAGSGHDNFLKGIRVFFKLYYPEYFSPQLQRYNYVDIISSMSKMHMITDIDIRDNCNGYVWDRTINSLNDLVKCYKEENDKNIKQELFMEIISNIPSGFCKWMDISTNYLQLKTIYNQRKNHKLPEWKKFCNFIEDLPMFKEIVLGVD